MLNICLAFIFLFRQSLSITYEVNYEKYEISYRMYHENYYLKFDPPLIHVYDEYLNPLKKEKLNSCSFFLNPNFSLLEHL